MVGVGSFCYGFGISPMYYSWGFFLTAMQKDIAISGAQAGFIFMVFSIVYHVLGAPVGVIMSRWGIRCVVVFGSAVAVLAFWLFCDGRDWRRFFLRGTVFTVALCVIALPYAYAISVIAGQPV